jgi:asparagine synthase (glutamine-hydrolysing)
VDGAKQIVPQWGDLYDEPFQDASGIPTYLVSKVAADQVKVVLSADGGDELFSGYNIYERALRHVVRRSEVPALVRRAVVALGNALPLEQIDEAVTLSPIPRSVAQLVRRKLTWRIGRIHDYLATTTNGALYEQAFSFWSPRAIQALTGRYERVRETTDDYPGTFAEQMCLWDVFNYLPGDILAKVDRATMAVSIEGRDPLIDHRIVEFAYRLPLSLRRGPLGTKHILRKILYKYVPRELVERPKMGFGIPLLEWLRGDLAHLIDDYLNRSTIRSQGILDPDVVARTVRLFRRGDDFAANRVWTLLAFQMWCEKWA